MVGATVAALLLTFSPGEAALNSSARVQAFSRLPDWSGLWEQFALSPSGAPTDPAEAQEIERISRDHPPYNPEWEARFQAAAQQRTAVADKPLCQLGFPTLMLNSPLMFQVIVDPEETTILFSQNETRHIYTDGRKHPPADELFVAPWGDSIGHWEGQTLMIDTVGTSAYYLPGNILSDQARYIERIRMLGDGTLEDRMTILDPVSLTKPWKLTRRYHRVPNMNRMVEEDCVGNDRDPVINGKFTLAPPRP